MLRYGESFSPHASQNGLERAKPGPGLSGHVGEVGLPPASCEVVGAELTVDAAVAGGHAVGQVEGVDLPRGFDVTYDKRCWLSGQHNCYGRM